MNVLTQIKNQQKISLKECELGINSAQSWHERYAKSAYVFCGGLHEKFTEGDLVTVLAQFGEVVDCEIVRDRITGKSRSFAFACYEDQRSTVLAVDNLNGSDVLGKVLRVQHCEDFRVSEARAVEATKERKVGKWKCATCGAERGLEGKQRCFKCNSLAPECAYLSTKEALRTTSSAEESSEDEDANGKNDDDDEIEEEKDEQTLMNELRRRKQMAEKRAKAIAEGLPFDDDDDDDGKKEAATRVRSTRKRKEKKEKKRSKKEKKKRRRRDDDDVDSQSYSSRS